jgi:hypothetical protein
MAALRLLEADVEERELRFRMPFRFGAATLEACPQLVLRIRAEVDGAAVGGVAAEFALPKWFDKSPTLRESDNVAQLRRSLALAVDVCRGAGRERSPFALHRAFAPEQLRRCEREALPPLVASFGVALVDRALIDATCRSAKQSFFDAVRSNLLGIDASLTPELSGFDLDGFLAGLRPAAAIAARHTVGLVDPLTAADLQGPRPRDPLPCTLEDCVERYGLTHFKLKLSGRADADVDRLVRIASVLDRLPEYRATLDGTSSTPTRTGSSRSGNCWRRSRSSIACGRRSSSSSSRSRGARRSRRRSRRSRADGRWRSTSPTGRSTPSFARRSAGTAASRARPARASIARSSTGRAARTGMPGRGRTATSCPPRT